MVAENKCLDCRWFVEIEGNEEGYGTCRYNAPFMDVSVSGAERGFPMVSLDGWCRQWQVVPSS